MFGIINEHRCRLEIPKSVAKPRLHKDFKDVNELTDLDESDENALLLNSYYKMPKTKADGNCFFESVALSLEYHYNIRKSITHLRNLVATRFLRFDDQEANQTLSTWLELANSSPKLDEIQHVRGFPKTPLQVETANVALQKYIFTPEQRLWIYGQIMKSSFWGEEFSLKTLELFLGISFVVFDGSKIKMSADSKASKIVDKIKRAKSSDIHSCLKQFILKSIDGQQANNNKKEICLYLVGKHYQPLLRRHK